MDTHSTKTPKAKCHPESSEGSIDRQSLKKSIEQKKQAKENRTIIYKDR